MPNSSFLDSHLLPEKRFGVSIIKFSANTQNCQLVKIAILGQKRAQYSGAVTRSLCRCQEGLNLPLKHNLDFSPQLYDDLDS